MSKKLRRTIFVTCVFIAIGITLMYWAAPYLIIAPFRAHCSAALPSDTHYSDEFSIKSTDGLNLIGRRTHIDSARGIIILVHGIGACKEQHLQLASVLAKQKIECFFFDLRGHGRSDGDYVTFGAKEKTDISTIVDYIQHEQRDLPIGIWGNSLGGAIAIQALENDARIDFGIIESTFSRLDEIVLDYMKRGMFGFGTKWISDILLTRAGHIADFEPFAINPEESVQNISQPMLFVHGTADEAIHYTHAQKLLAACSADNKELHLVAGAGHNNVKMTGGNVYQRKALHFISLQLTK